MVHISVLLYEAIEYLAVKPEGVYVDGTLGGGGHSSAIYAQLSDEGRLYCFDRDRSAIAIAENKLGKKNNITYFNSNFRNMKKDLVQEGVFCVDGILLDLGVSSFQIDTPERGFSYMHAAPLDMRMDMSQKLTAAAVVNSYDERSLATLMYNYGEESAGRKIAGHICKVRARKQISTTADLLTAVQDVMGLGKAGMSAARRVFQAIRIEVNDELSAISSTLADAVTMLNPGGRIVVISFHSLEDKMVKGFFAKQANTCTCPPFFPKCVCNTRPVLKLLTRKAVVPASEELENNPRAGSAKLRAAERL